MLLQMVRFTIRQRLAALILLSALPACIVILILGVRNSEREIDKTKRELLSFVNRAADTQERETAAIRLLLENLARNPDVRKADVAACSHLFADVLRLNSAYGALHLVDLRGDMLATGRSARSANFSKVAHFLGALDSSEFVVGEYLLGVTLGVPVITFGSPVMDEHGKMQSVLLTSILLDSYGRFFEQLHLPQNSFFGVCDRNGIRLFRSPEVAGVAYGRPISKSLFASACSGSEEGLATDTGSDGVERLVAYRQLRLGPGKPAYMYMFVGIPKAAVYEKARMGLLRDFGLLLLTVLVTLAGGWFLGGRTLGRSLEDLAVAANRIGKGDLSVRVSRVTKTVEVEVLAGAFNGMAEALCRDQGERRRNEDELLEARNQAEAANRAKSMFLANMSHELRTPLNGLLGMLQLIKDGAEPEEVEDFLDMAIRSGQRLTGLLGDLLDISRIEAGGMCIKRQPFALAGISAALVESFSPMLTSKKLPLVMAIAPNVPPILVGDEVRVRQILFNLVGNAMKFTDSGEVRLEVSTLLPQPDGGPRLLFIVSDTGIGIPNDKFDHICKPFTQVSEDITRTHQGAGLGLAIARHLVTAMGGTLAFDSQENLGTSVYLMLPFGGPDRGEAPATQPQSPASCDASLNLLLVEDDEISRMGAQLLLGRLGHKVVAAANGEEALQLLRTERFDCVFMDIQMDVMDGVETTRRIRGGASGVLDAQVPIIAMTAYTMIGDREQFLAAGMDDYVAKPVFLEHLRAALGRVCPSARVA